MRTRWQIKCFGRTTSIADIMRQVAKNKFKLFIASILLLFCTTLSAEMPHDKIVNTHSENTSIDRIELVNEQVQLLKNRLNQAENELSILQQDENISQVALEKASKSLLDKSALDISVAKSNLESINIELADSQQTISWLEKNIQEIENQLNILNIFGLKVAPNEAANLQGYRADLKYQRKLMDIEKTRVKYLQDLQNVANNILTLERDRYNRLNALLKSRRLLHIKQQQVKDELVFQQQQNDWLMQVNVLHSRLAKIDPISNQPAYAALERDIYYANENANFAYVQSLMARYKDQIQQMKMAVFKSNSISLFNEVSNQVQSLNKQIGRLEASLQGRTATLTTNINSLLSRQNLTNDEQQYLQHLKTLASKYKTFDAQLNHLTGQLLTFRKTLDEALQNELSARQGFPTFGVKTLVDLGKEMLLVPALTFQVLKSLSTHFIKAFHTASIFLWSLFLIGEFFLLFSFFLLRKLLLHFLKRPEHEQEQISARWLFLNCVHRNFVEILVITNLIGVLYFFDVPQQNLIFAMYLSLVWLLFKCIISVLRVCLVETTHDTTGHDMRLYKRLSWLIRICGLVTGLTVFVHQLPLIYELKTLCDRLFLFLLMVISLLLIRSWDVLPNLILSQMESQHPYLQKSIRSVGILIPILLFGNSLIGLTGFVNLVMTMSWYEGVFLIVLIGYLILRGLLSDAMEQLSRMMIQYVNNGWLWTEAFLKPLDKVLRITLFLFAWAMLFLLYGWDKHSPIVARLSGLLQYQLVNILNSAITPLSIIELFIVISIFYWTAKWTREFVYRMLLSRTKDLGIRNSIAILSQYSVIIIGVFLCLRVLGIDLRALTVVAASFAFGVGLGLRDLANNFASGFLLLFERPLRVGDIVSISGFEGEVTHIGSRAVTIQTWDHMELMVPNAEIFSKSFTNWTAKDNIVRSVAHIKISRFDNPHAVKVIIHNVLTSHKEILKDPIPDVYLKAMDDTVMEFELRYYVNIRQVNSRVSVLSSVLMQIWDAFMAHGIKPPYPLHQVHIKNEMPMISLDDSKTK